MDTDKKTQLSETKDLKRQARWLIADKMYPETATFSKKTGRLVCRWAFFYTHGRTSEKYASAVTELLSRHGIPHTIADHGQVWKAWRGDASVANQSHFYVEIQIG